MALAPGTRLGPYEIGARIGVGGMGEVYRAKDTNLGRDVAIKVLPEAFAQDPERVARFEREATTLASLNHPNIAIIHGLEKADGLLALVMELIQGATLADRVAQGPIAIAEALPIARQIAEAVEAAHEQGIIHRDLKPANVKVRDDDTVKVLDFGLAKILEPVGTTPSVSQSPTIATPAMTQVGVMLGTAAYMSPEQAKGKTADKRSDVWAFGCVLYEMLTGRSAFAGEGVVETLGAVIQKNPDWTALPADTPQEIGRLLRRCLHKDRRQRLPDIGTARIEIQDAISEGPAAFVESVGTGRRTHERLAWFVAASMLVLVVALVVALSMRSPPAESQTYRASLLPLDAAPIVGPPPSRFALSPDGRYLCLVSGRANKPSTLWLRSLDREFSRELTGTEGATTPFWSHDSRFIAFYAQGKLKKLDITGGPPITLTDADTAASVSAGTWSKDDIIVFPRLRGPLFRIHAGGGPVTAVTALDVAAGDDRHYWPHFLPDGRHFLYEAIGSPSSVNDPRAVYIASLDPAEKPRLLLNGGSNAKYAQGYVLFMRETTLMAQRFDTRQLEFAGEPLAIADDVVIGGSTELDGAFSVSPAGILVYEVVREEAARQLTWFDRSGNQSAASAERAAYGANIELSPDATRAVVNVSSAERLGMDFWILDLVRGNRSPFTQTVAGRRAVWTPDGRIAFNGGGQASTRDLYVKSSNGIGPEERIFSDPSLKVPLSWSHNGKFLLYATLGAGEENLWVLPLSGDRTPIPYMQTASSERGARFSHDDRWVAYGSNQGGQPQIYVAPFPETGKRYTVSTAGTLGVIVGARWRRDDRELFYISRDRQMMAADIDGRGPDLTIGSIKSLFRIPGSGPIAYDADPNGQRFLINFTDVERTSGSPLTMQINWTASLDQPPR
jgi:eukaryotic-like serine/threonine-protein kinase